MLRFSSDNAHRISGQMCSFVHTIWVGGTCFSTGAGAITVAHCLLEFPGQWGGYTTVFMFSQQFSWWIPSRRSIVSKSRCQRPTSNRYCIRFSALFITVIRTWHLIFHSLNRISFVGHCGWYTATSSIQCGCYVWSKANLIMQLHMFIGCILVLSCGCCVSTSYSLCKLNKQESNFFQPSIVQKWKLTNCYLTPNFWFHLLFHCV